LVFCGWMMITAVGMTEKKSMGRCEPARHVAWPEEGGHEFCTVYRLTRSARKVLLVIRIGVEEYKMPNGGRLALSLFSRHKSFTATIRNVVPSQLNDCLYVQLSKTPFYRPITPRNTQPRRLAMP